MAGIGPRDIKITPGSGTCDFHDDHDAATDRPCGNRCGRPAVAQIVWLDGSRRYSMACERHIDVIDEDIPHRVEMVAIN